MTISMIVKVTREQQVQIEEACLSEGLTFSQYFMKLHDEKISPELKKIEEQKQEVIQSIFSSIEDPCMSINTVFEPEKIKRKPGRPSRNPPK